MFRHGNASDEERRSSPSAFTLPVRAYDFSDSIRDADAVLDAAFVAARGEVSESVAELKSL